MTGICDCITAYKLTDVLSKATRLKRMQQVLVDGCYKGNPPDESGKLSQDAIAMVQSFNGSTTLCICMSLTVSLRTRFDPHNRSDMVHHACTQSNVTDKCTHSHCVLVLQQWL